MVRGFRASCGKGVHGKEAAAEGELRRCFACDRPGSRDGCSTRWQHVGNSETWALLGEWSLDQAGVMIAIFNRTLSGWGSASVPDGLRDWFVQAVRVEGRGTKKDLCTKWWLDSGRRWAGTPRRALRYGAADTPPLSTAVYGKAFIM